MKHILKAAFLSGGISLFLAFSFNLVSPSDYFDNPARTIYLVTIAAMFFGGIVMKNILSYKLEKKVNYSPKAEEAKTTGLAFGVILLLIISPYIDKTGSFTICDCQWLHYIGALFLIDSITFLAWSGWVFGKKFFRNDGKPAKQELVASGPYMVIRHPWLLAFMTWAIATALVFNNYISLVLAFLVIWLCILKAKDEEVFMELEFGDEWLLYKKKTHRFIPFIF